jgi:hypothetical protein
MKATYFNLIIIFSITSCNFTKEKKHTEKGNTIISKVKYKKNTTGLDTLWVSQNDTSVFRKEEVMISRPCSNPELNVRYELLKPKNEAYYFIYNNKKQLIEEGKYTIEYTYEGQTYKRGDFYNLKSYFYESNGNLELIHYMEDGRNNKTEFFDSKKRLTEVTYFDKKSSDKTKVEIYNNGELEETHIYTSFDNYYTEKAKN